MAGLTTATISHPLSRPGAMTRCSNLTLERKLRGRYSAVSLRDVLADLPHDHESDHALDFACGTGRITEVVRDSTWQVIGLDASAAMIEQARIRLPGVVFLHGFLEDQDIQAALRAFDRPFKLVTAFRFFLNAPAESRVPTLRGLVEQLDATGVLVLNNHGSGPSLRNAGLHLRRKLGSTTISQREFAELLRSAGLVVEARWGAQVSRDHV